MARKPTSSTSTPASTSPRKRVSGYAIRVEGFIPVGSRVEVTAQRRALDAVEKITRGDLSDLGDMEQVKIQHKFTSRLAETAAAEAPAADDENNEPDTGFFAEGDEE